MNLREQNGFEISKTKVIMSGVDGWIVPSQSSNKNILFARISLVVALTIKKEVVNANTLLLKHKTVKSISLKFY